MIALLVAAVALAMPAPPAGAAEAASGAAFVDPLDAPARLSPRAARAPVNALAKVDADHVVAVGPRGHILRSADRGKTWRQQRSPVSTDLLAVHFASPKLGWIVGHDGVILRSDDGGIVWTRVLDGRTLGAAMVAYYEKRGGIDGATAKALDEARRFVSDGPTRPLMAVYFRNEREGWAVGQFNLILHTADGGASWQPWLDRTENPEGYSLHAIGAAGDDVVIVGELGLVLRLDVQAQRFRRVKTPYSGTWFGFAASSRAIVATGLRGSAWRSSDGGASWQPLVTGTPAAINGGQFLADGRLVLFSQQGQVLISADLGQTFSALPAAGAPTSAFDALAMDPGWLLVAGPQGVLRVPVPGRAGGPT